MRPFFKTQPMCVACVLLFKQNWFRFVVKAAALKQQTSRFYVQISNKEDA